MTIEMPPDLEQRIQAQVDRGRYDSALAVVREAMDSLEQRQRAALEIQRMIAETEEDVRHGRLDEFDAEETKAALRKMLRQDS